MVVNYDTKNNCVSSAFFEFQLMTNLKISLCTLGADDEQFYYEEFDKESISKLITHLEQLKDFMK